MPDWTLTPDPFHPAVVVGGPPAAPRVTLPAAIATAPAGGPPPDPAAGLVEAMMLGLLQAADADPAVQRWRELGGQLAAAEARGRDAANRAAAADAAEALLKTDPVPGLAAELRRVAGERTQALADARAAEEELAVLRPLARGLWNPAVWALEGHWHAAFAARLAELTEAEAVTGAAAEAAVRMAVAGLAEPLGVLYAARRKADRLRELAAYGSPVRNSVLGPEPKAGG